eukprot:6923437-Karenia_brevis.AAC.1
MACISEHVRASSCAPTHLQAEWTSFTSCTKDPSVAVQMAKTAGSGASYTVFAILARRAYEVHDYSLFPKEKEVVLLPNTRLESWGVTNVACEVVIRHLHKHTA